MVTKCHRIRRKEWLNLLGKSVTGDVLRRPHRKQLLFGNFIDKENLLRNEQIQAQSQLLGAFATVGKGCLAQESAFKQRVREKGNGQGEPSPSLFCAPQGTRRKEWKTMIIPYFQWWNLARPLMALAQFFPPEILDTFHRELIYHNVNGAERSFLETD